VILAAGLDTRAFRLSWPQGTRFFELDQAEVLAYKEEILRENGAQAACERKAIAADLRNDEWQEALIGAGFDPHEPSGWLIEGLLPYLPMESVEHVFKEVAALTGMGSWLGFDAFNWAMLTSQWSRELVQRIANRGTPWISGIDDPVAFAQRFGWKDLTLCECREEGKKQGRQVNPPVPEEAPDQPYHWLVTAQKEA
jgi:methyltransferase (TIGR00027 family)